MIIVWGSVETDVANRDEALRLSLEHVRRSRAEPGCISHAVSIDAENNNRLTFFEEWDDLEALHRHFAVPESAAFVARLSAIAERPPELRMFQASPLKSQ